LIDFIDPIIVAEKVATADEHRVVSIREIIRELKEGARSIGGKGVLGKRKILQAPS